MGVAALPYSTTYSAPSPPKQNANARTVQTSARRGVSVSSQCLLGQKEKAEQTGLGQGSGPERPENKQPASRLHTEAILGTASISGQALPPQPGKPFLPPVERRSELSGVSPVD